MLALSLANPVYAYQAKKLGITFTDDEYFQIADVYYGLSGTDHKYYYQFTRWNESFPLADRHWKKIIENGISLYDFKRVDCPQYAREAWLRKASIYNLSELEEISVEDFKFYLDKHKDHLTKFDYKELFNLKNGYFCTGIEEFLREKGQYIKYINYPSVKLCKAAIDNDPKNIKFIHVKAESVYLYALEKYKSVKKLISEEHLTENVRKAIGITKAPNPFKEKYYLVTFDCDLCDESNVIKVCVIEGKDMQDFLNQKFIISFGNLDDDRVRRVKDYAFYKPISEKEYDVLKNFGLDDLMSGYFNIDDFDD